MSPQIEGVLGYRPDEWMATPRLWIDRIHPEDRADVIDETERCVLAGDPFKLEYRMLSRSGRVVWLHDVASVMSRDETGRSLRYHGVQLDITDRKQAEHAGRGTVERLRQLGQQRHRLLSSLVTVQEVERRRIAESIQDQTQRLASLSMVLRAVAMSDPEIERFDGFSEGRDALTIATGELRDLVFELHPAVLETEGLVPALRLLLDRWESPDAPSFVVSDRLTRQPSAETGSALYRIAQEALTNVRKHSGATNVTVSIEEQDKGFSLVISDDGVGFDTRRAPQRNRVGLISMRERAEIAGGSCSIRSRPGHGTKVETWLPEADEATRRSGVLVAASTDVPAAGESTPETTTRIGNLTPRETDVARLLALGHTNAEIAAVLYLSVRTVEQHRARVFRKLGVRSRAALVQRLDETPPLGSAPELRPPPRT